MRIGTLKHLIEQAYDRTNSLQEFKDEVISLLETFERDGIGEKQDQTLKEIYEIGIPRTAPKEKCSKCGLKLLDEFGNYKVMNYFCGNDDCPCGLGSARF